MFPHPVCMPSPCGRAGAAVHAGSAYRRMAMVRGTHERELMIVRLAQSREYRFAEWAGIKVQSWDADLRGFERKRPDRSVRIEPSFHNPKDLFLVLREEGS